MDIFKSLIVWVIGIFYFVVFFPFTFIIWLIVLPFDRERVIIHWILMYQSTILVRLIPIWNINIEGREKYKKGTSCVIISNHQSLLDILLINCLRIKFKWVSKIENSNLPVLGWYLRMAGYITVNRGNEESKAEMLDKSLYYLKNGMPVMLFPEGTRSPDNEVILFRRGAFQLALEAKVPVLPIVVDGTGGILPKHGLIFSTGHTVTVRVLDMVYPESFNTDNVEILADSFRNLIASELKRLRTKTDNS